MYVNLINDNKMYPNAFNYEDAQALGSASIYNYIPFVELLCEKTMFMNNLVGEKLLPTYSYGRIYKTGAALGKHLDRESCEISVTINLGSKGGSWPIWFTKPDGTVISYDLSPGQAVVYLGCISEHWRDSLSGDDYGQFFLHYVRGRGPHACHAFDAVRLNRGNN